MKSEESLAARRLSRQARGCQFDVRDMGGSPEGAVATRGSVFDWLTEALIQSAFPKKFPAFTDPQTII